MAGTTRQWEIATSSGVFRLGVGVGLITMRGFGARMFGAERDDKVVPALLAAFGVRDSLLGLAALASTRPGANVANQLRLQAANDVFDAAVVGGMVATGALPKGRGLALIAVSAIAAAGDYTLSRLAAKPAGLSLSG